MNWFTKLFRWFFKPKPVTDLYLQGLSTWRDPQNIFYYDRSKRMKVAKVEASWVKSVSPDVVSQQFMVMQEGSGMPLVEKTLSAEANSTVFEVPEKTSVTISVSAFDGTFTSDPASLTFSVEDLTKPLPPAGLSAVIIEVMDLDNNPVG